MATKRFRRVIASAVVLWLGMLMLPMLGSAQRRDTTTPGAPSRVTQQHACNLLNDQISDPQDSTKKIMRPIDNKLLTSGLPCQENLNFTDPEGKKSFTEVLQRSFDFYSWLTFIAMNSPADG